MPFLVIAGVTMLVQKQGASEKIERLGRKRRAFAGNLLSSQRGSYSVITFSTAPMLEADYQTLKAAVEGGSFVACSGDALKAAEDYCVEIDEADYVADGLGFKRVLTLTMTEVS